MPELPEVEIITSELRDNIINKNILTANVSDYKLRYHYPNNFINILKGKKIIKISRRGRYILLELSDNFILLIHLGMSGKFTFFDYNMQYKINKHDHIMIKFSDNSLLIYNDIRRFGFVDLFPLKDLKNHNILNSLGTEPLSPSFNKESLKRKLKNKKINIKTAMMDNKIVTGIGNIYINEALFLSKISPLRESNKLTDDELKKLIKNIKLILKDAIDKGGSTIRNYKRLSNNIGNFQYQFNIYGKKKTKCELCNSSSVVRIKQNGRSSFFCPNCQK